MTDLQANDAQAHRAAMREDEFELVASRAGQAFAPIAGYAELSPPEKERLCRDLIKAKRHFETRQRCAAIPTDTAAESLISGIRNSINKLVEFSTAAIGADAKGQKAFLMLCEADSIAADQHPLESEAFLHEFLSDVQRFQEAVKRAPLRRNGVPPAFALTPTEQFIGADLPKIFETFFGPPFTANPAIGPARASKGIEFIHAARFALGLEKMADETIRTHWKAKRCKSL